jgi:phosphonate transport system substrate-binding protein
MKSRFGNLSALVCLLGASLFLSSCTVDKGELGSSKNPIKLYFVPSVDAKVIENNSKTFKDWLEANTPYKFEVSIPQSYIAVVEALGSNRADVASINTFGYILAHEKYGAQARLTVIRHGLATYQSQIIAKEGGPIKALADISGKKVAFVDPASTSGFLLPKKLFADKGVKPSQEIFAMKHDSVVSMVYQGQADAGATFYSPVTEGEIQDARRLVKTQYPDVEKKVKIIELTEAIPNDPIVFRKELSDEMKNKLVEAFEKFVATPEGKDTFNKVYGVTELKRATDADYDKVRLMLKSLGQSAEELMVKK